MKIMMMMILIFNCLDYNYYFIFIHKLLLEKMEHLHNSQKFRNENHDDDDDCEQTNKQYIRRKLWLLNHYHHHQKMFLTFDLTFGSVFLM